MANAVISPKPKFTAIDVNGDPYAGAKLYTYETGTTTPKATWTDATKAVQNANPVILDSKGQADVWIDLSSGEYRFKLTDADDVVLWTKDHVSAVSGDPAGIDDYSTDVDEMQTATDPYPAEAESLATSLAGEIERIRYQLAAILGESYWYIDPDATIIDLLAGKVSLVSKTAAYTATSSDHVILVDATAGGVTITMPTAVGISGKSYVIVKIDSSANAVTVDADGSETINGAATASLGDQYNFTKIVSNNANWNVISEKLAQPDIGDFTNAQHDHGDAANGGGITDFTNLQHDHVSAATGGALGAEIQSQGSQVVAASGNWTPPEGRYNFVSDGGGDIVLRLYVNGAWYEGTANFIAGTVICDGTNVNFKNNNVGAADTLYYQKF